jgi:hypothetical protein
MAGYFVHPSMYKKVDPWQYLNDCQNSDRGYDPDELIYINAKMQELYPGKYKIVKKASEYGRFKYYDFEFETPAAETMFKLKYSK